MEANRLAIHCIGKSDAVMRSPVVQACYPGGLPSRFSPDYKTVLSQAKLSVAGSLFAWHSFQDDRRELLYCCIDAFVLF